MVLDAMTPVKTTNSRKIKESIDICMRKSSLSSSLVGWYKYIDAKAFKIQSRTFQKPCLFFLPMCKKKDNVNNQKYLTYKKTSQVSLLCLCCFFKSNIICDFWGFKSNNKKNLWKLHQVFKIILKIDVKVQLLSH